MFGIRLTLLALLTASSCGYALRDTSRQELATLGVRTIYVEPLANNTFKGGVETVVYNALLKTISAQKGVKLTSEKSQADAVLSGTVGQADYAPSLRTQTDLLSPKTFGRGDVRVASVYQANLGCFFELNRTRLPKPDSATRIWAANFARSKQFSASTQLSVAGTTSALINDSEYDRALQNLAESMTLDVHQAMTSLF